jgi:hypothetical protein
MSVLGQFLEFSVHTPDILDSLGFYKRLGFTEQTIGDVWPHKYAVVSDGVISIGLHEREMESPALTFVQHDLARHARGMTDHGLDFRFLQLDEDIFNELGFTDRDGHLVAMQEARTFMQPDEDTPDSLCGSFFEATLPARNTVRSGHFWAPLVPHLLNLREEPTTHMRFDTGQIAIGLSESIALSTPSLCFKCDDKESLTAMIDSEYLSNKKFPGFEGAFVELTAPEGTKIYVFDEDFLGESYVVDEMDEMPEDV